MDNFTLTSALEINRAVTIDGNNKTITGPTITEKVKENGIVISANDVVIKGLTVTSSKGYNIQFYNVTGGELNNVTLSNAVKGGLLVNSSTVTVKNIETSGNGWGGIEVSVASTLTVGGTSKHSENVHIWTIDSSKVIDTASQYKSGADIRDDKDGYTNFILTSETSPVPHTKEEKEAKEEEEEEEALKEALKEAKAEVTKVEHVAIFSEVLAMVESNATEIKAKTSAINEAVNLISDEKAAEKIAVGEQGLLPSHPFKVIELGIAEDKSVWVDVYKDSEKVGPGGSTRKSPSIDAIRYNTAQLTLEAGDYTVVVKDGENGKVIKLLTVTID